ncbi:restriction endonuclease subunit S [Streptomyces sp. NPDC039022]|uniref:restriction endonuclease subunit S n=1 Tax=Streptomyces sp. NPDC039022 TaxID=3157091 RepID=UPI0033DEAFDC
MALIESPWGKVRVKRLATKIGSGKTPAGGSETYVDQGVLFLRSQNIHFDGLRLDDVAYIDANVHREMRATQVALNDVLLNITGASIGRVTRVPEEIGEANVNQHVCIIRPNAATDSRYLTYGMSARFMQGQIQELQVGGNRDGLNFEQVGNLELPAPPLDEQCRIADFLDVEIARIDSLSTARDAQVRCLKELWVSRLAHRVELWIAEHGLVPLRRVVESIEQGWSPQCDDTIATPSEWAVLKTSAVSSGTFKPLEHKRLPHGTYPDLRYQISDGDILMTRGSGSPEHVGIPTVAHPVGRRLLLSDLLYRIRLSHGWSSEFTSFVLKSQPIRGFMALLFRGQSGQTIKLRADDIRAINIPAVPAHLQEQYAEDLEEERQALYSAVAALRKSSALLAEHRQSLITAAVTGQIDVSAASGRGIEE